MNHLELEAAVVGMVMREPTYLSEAVSRGLTPSHFVDALHNRIFAACVEIWREGLEVDLATVARKVGMERLDEISRVRSNSPLTVNFAPYLSGMLATSIHAELSLRLIDISRALTSRKPLEPIEPIIDRLVELIAYAKGSNQALRTTPINAEVDRALTQNDGRIELFRSGKISGVTTGFKPLDRILCGFQPGFIYALGARTGVGKTTFAVNVTLGAARRGHKVAFVTVEMSGADLVEKMLSREARVPGQRLLAGALTDVDAQQILTAARNLEALPILFTEVVRPSIEHLAFEILRLVKVEKADLIVVDYIQLFEVGDGRQRMPREEAKIVSSRLKSLARTNDVPILFLSQLNRLAPESGEPDLVHIAESDQIARDSDVVMFLYRDEERHFLSIAKNRRGMCRAFELQAELEYSRFEAPVDAH